MSEQPFEDALDEVERIATELERGQLTLDEALARFEDGMTKLASLRERLEAIEQQVTKVFERHGKLVEEPLGNDET